MTAMKPNDALHHFGSVSAIASVCGCEQPSVSEWFSRGKIPDGRQYQIQIATNGALKADLPADRRKKKKAA